MLKSALRWCGRGVGLIALLVAAERPLEALDVACEPQSKPLLQIVRFSDNEELLPPGERRAVTLLCKDGRWLHVLLNEGGSPFPYTAQVTRGRLPAAALAELEELMAAAGIGRMRDCSFAIAGQPGHRVRTVDSITWFGARGRRNQLRFSFLFPSDAATCSPEELEMLLAFDSIPANPTETLAFP